MPFVTFFAVIAVMRSICYFGIGALVILFGGRIERILQNLAGCRTAQILLTGLALAGLVGIFLRVQN